MPEYLYGLLKYSTNNIGDEIQSIAARQFLPRVDLLLDRDKLDTVKSTKKIKLIMNGWFTHSPERWPPSPNIEPLFISFHITPSAAEQMTSDISLAYFKEHEPIGCRDTYTMKLLCSKGVVAYFSGCLTLTLEKTAQKQSEEVLLVDIEKRSISNLPQSLIGKAISINHYVFFPPAGFFSSRLSNIIRSYYAFLDKLDHSSLIKRVLIAILNCAQKFIGQRKRFRKAKELLNRYTQAQLVVTSRLHCALPCVAYGTPVVFIYNNLSKVRFTEYLKYFPSYSIDDIRKSQVNLTMENHNKHLKELAGITATLKEKCRAFIQDDRDIVV